VAVLVGTVAFASAQAAQVGKAVVRVIKGAAECSEGGAWSALKVGQEIRPGTVVRTANDSYVDLFLDQNGPMVRLTENTVLGIDKLNFEPTGADTVIETQLDVKSGRIVGIVKKLAATSKYEVKTPSGVAGIRGTDYSIGADGSVYVVSGSVVVVSVKSDGTVVTQVVNAGEMFNPATQKPEPVPQDKMDQLLKDLGQLKGGVVAAPAIEPPPVIFISPTVGK
jgi:hypothetical protein